MKTFNRFGSKKLEEILMHYLQSAPESIEGMQIKREYHTSLYTGGEVFYFEAYNDNTSYIYDICVIPWNVGSSNPSASKEVSLSAFICSEFESISEKYEHSESIMQKVHDLYLLKYFANTDSGTGFNEIKAYYDNNLNPVSGDQRIILQ